MFISVDGNITIPQENGGGSQVFYHPEGTSGGKLLAKSIQEVRSVENLKNTDREALAIKGVYL